MREMLYYYVCAYSPNDNTNISIQLTATYETKFNDF